MISLILAETWKEYRFSAQCVVNCTSCSDIESVAGIKLRYRARASIFPPTFARYRPIFAWPTSSYRVLL